MLQTFTCVLVNDYRNAALDGGAVSRYVSSIIGSFRANGIMDVKDNSACGKPVIGMKISTNSLMISLQLRAISVLNKLLKAPEASYGSLCCVYCILLALQISVKSIFQNTDRLYKVSEENTLRSMRRSKRQQEKCLNHCQETSARQVYMPRSTETGFKIVH